MQYNKSITGADAPEYGRHTMKLYQLTDHETALLLEALSIASCNAHTTGTEPDKFQRLFRTIVQQHDLQLDPEEVQ